MSLSYFKVGGFEIKFFFCRKFGEFLWGVNIEKNYGGKDWK